MMDKEPKVETTEDEILIEGENDDAVQDSEVIERLETTEASPVVVKKSSGGLSLLISLLALAGVSYLIFKDWQNSRQENAADVPNNLIQQLQDSDKVLSTDLQNIKVDIKQLQQKTNQVSSVDERLTRLSDQVAIIENNPQKTVENTNPNQGNTYSQFDNRNNEEALAQLQEQLKGQAQIISELQSTPPSTKASNQGITHGPLLSNQNQIEKNAAVQVLLTTDVLLTTHRLPQAITALDNYLKVSGLKSVDKNKLLRLLNQLKQINQPDIKQIEQQLQVVKSTIDGLQISTQESASDESKWYEKFVSVKKIDTKNNLNSTAHMIAFKTELNRLLYQAKLFLILNDQAGWQSSLKTALQRLNDEMPQNNKLSELIDTLSNQAVVPTIPTELNLTAVIDELNGLH